MSAILFHLRDTDEPVVVHGSERRLFQTFSVGLTAQVLCGPSVRPLDELTPLMDEETARELIQRAAGPWHGSTRAQRELIQTWLQVEAMVGGAIAPATLLTEHDGTRTPVTELILNTAIAAGSNPVKLLAWIDGCCESHGRFVGGAPTKWLRETVADGLASGIFNLARGWSDLIRAIDHHWGSTIVMSYSGCERFPNASVLDLDDSTAARHGELEKFEASPRAEQWDRCIAALEAKSWPPAFATPGLMDQGFLTGHSAFDVRRVITRRRDAERDDRN